VDRGLFVNRGGYNQVRKRKTITNYMNNDYTPVTAMILIMICVMSSSIYGLVCLAQGAWPRAIVCGAFIIYNLIAFWRIQKVGNNEDEPKQE
jgi:hypothetical protein